MRRRWTRLATVAGLIAMTAGGWTWHRHTVARASETAYARAFDHVIARVQGHYVDSVDPSALYQEAASAVVASLDDPYSELLVGESYRQYRRQVSGEEVTLGAAAAGGRSKLGPGDAVLEIDGRSTAGWTREQVDRALAASSARTVSVVVRPRGSAQPVRRTLTRITTHVPATSPGVLLDGGVGYVALHMISESASTELRRSLDQLATRGMHSLILDLRHNPGGLIKEGVAITELFLDRGDTIGTARGRRAEHTRAYVADGPATWRDLPLVLIVDRHTASSAELIAGALQDHDRAVIVGAPSYGKGVLQTTYPLGEQVALKLTTARWFTPSGRSIQRRPDSVRVQGPRGPTRYRSDAGRPLPDSSGIVPDVVIRPTLSDLSGRWLLRSLGSEVELFQSVVADYVRETRGRARAGADRVAEPATPAELDALRGRLSDAGVDLSSDLLAASAGYVGLELSCERARQARGVDADGACRAAADRQIQTASALLREARDIGSVFGAARRAVAIRTAGAP